MKSLGNAEYRFIFCITYTGEDEDKKGFCSLAFDFSQIANCYCESSIVNYFHPLYLNGQVIKKYFRASDEMNDEENSQRGETA